MFAQLNLFDEVSPVPFVSMILFARFVFIDVINREPKHRACEGCANSDCEYAGCSFGVHVFNEKGKCAVDKRGYSQKDGEEHGCA